MISFNQYLAVTDEAATKLPGWTRGIKAGTNPNIRAKDPKDLELDTFLKDMSAMIGRGAKPNEVRAAIQQFLPMMKRRGVKLTPQQRAALKKMGIKEEILKPDRLQPGDAKILAKIQRQRAQTQAKRKAGRKARAAAQDAWDDRKSTLKKLNIQHDEAYTVANVKITSTQDLGTVYRWLKWGNAAKTGVATKDPKWAKQLLNIGSELGKRARTGDDNAKKALSNRLFKGMDKKGNLLTRK